MDYLPFKPSSVLFLPIDLHQNTLDLLGWERKAQLLTRTRGFIQFLARLGVPTMIVGCLQTDDDRLFPPLRFNRDERQVFEIKMLEQELFGDASLLTLDQPLLLKGGNTLIAPGRMAPLQKWMKEHGTETLLLGGMHTNICLSLNVHCCAQFKIRCGVVTDLLADSSWLGHERHHRGDPRWHQDQILRNQPAATSQTALTSTLELASMMTRGLLPFPAHHTPMKPKPYLRRIEEQLRQKYEKRIPA